jgi:hypothetical protein
MPLRELCPAAHAAFSPRPAGSRQSVQARALEKYMIKKLDNNVKQFHDLRVRFCTTVRQAAQPSTHCLTPKQPAGPLSHIVSTTLPIMSSELACLLCLRYDFPAMQRASLPMALRLPSLHPHPWIPAASPEPEALPSLRQCCSRSAPASSTAYLMLWLPPCRSA